MKSLVIIGSGPFLASAAALARSQRRSFSVVEVHTIDGFIFPLEKVLTSFSPCDAQIFVALDARAVNSARSILIDQVAQADYSFTSLIAPDSYIAESARIGTNVYIGSGCHILEETRIDDGCWLASGVLLDRGAQIGCHATLGVGTIIGEAAEVGRNSSLSAGSYVIAGGKVGEYCEWLIGGKLPATLPDRSFFDNVMPQGARIYRASRLG